MAIQVATNSILSPNFIFHTEEINSIIVQGEIAIKKPIEIAANIIRLE